MVNFNPQNLRPHLLSLLFILVIAGNLFILPKELSTLRKVQKRIPFMEIGKEFEGLKPFLNNAAYIGYYSDTLKTSDESKKLMAQAQYVLVPVILDDENLDHPLLLLVCSRGDIALQKAKELGYTPLKTNNSGMMLAAKNP